MFILRLLAVIVVIAVAGRCRNLPADPQPEIPFSWRVFRYSLIVALLVFA